MARFTALALLALASFASAMYDKSDAVIQLTESDFEKRVMKDSGLWLVEVYAPWCGHCKSLAPAWKAAAKALKGIVNVAAIDGEAAKSISQKLGVQGFPTIKFFAAGGAAQDYDGGRDAPAIVQWAMKQASSIVQKRMSGKDSGASGKGGKESGKAAGKGAKEAGKESGKKTGPKPSGGGSGGKYVVEVTEENFEDEVLAAEEPVFVEFFAPWCGHCKSLAPEWASAADTLAGDVKFTTVDATVHGGLTEQFGVKGYPTIFMFPGGGKKNKKAAQPYQGARTADGLVAAAQKLVETSGGAKVVPLSQLTSATIWEEQCGSKRLCLLTILPHILDDGATKREGRLAMLAEAARAAGQKNLFRFLWAQAGDHPALESKLNVGVVPALYAISDDKKVFAAHRGAVDATHIAKFASALASNAGGVTPFPADFAPGAAIATVAPWDGKDGKLEVAEEFSLDDLEL